MKKLSLFLILFSIGFISFAQKGRTLSTAKEIEQRGEQFRVPATADQNFIAQDVNGNTWNLYELLDEGKYVMLDFDNTNNCSNCSDCVPDINTAYTSYGCNFHDVIILNITTDTSLNDTSKQYPVLLNGANGTYNHYVPNSVPNSILIAPNKHIINKNLYPTIAGINMAFTSAGISENYCDTIPTLRANFSGLYSRISTNETVTFTDESTQADNPITSWEWTFEGGNPSTFNGQNPPEITYIYEGCYNVKLKVNDGLDTAEKIKEKYIIVNDYCDASSLNTNPNYEYISNVKFANINKTSEASTYSDFTSEVAIVNSNQIVTVTIANPYQSDKLYAWIDWNRDGDFDDYDEQVCNKSALSSPVIFNINLTDTYFYDLDIIRMRIRLEDSENNGNETPCGVSGYGEVEDYFIRSNLCISINNISNNTFAIYPNPNNGVFNIVTTNNASNKITITDISGKLVYENNTNTNNILVDLNNVNKGIYFVKIFNEAGVKIEKIIIK